MKKMSAKKAGFTLIELMIVVAILGILAAIAIPAFATYIRRSKSGEVAGNIESLFKGLSAYYNKEFTTGPGIGASQLAHCMVAATSTIAAPNDTKQLQVAGTLVDGQPFAENGGIGYNVGASYYQYTNVGGAAACTQASNFDIYTLQAIGNLDNDNSSSTFQLATRTNPSNEIYKAGTMFITNELE